MRLYSLVGAAAATALLGLAAGAVQAEKPVRVALPVSAQSFASATTVVSTPSSSTPAPQDQRRRAHQARELPANFCLTHTC